MFTHQSSLISALRRGSYVALLSLGLCVAAAPGYADQLNPNDFTSLHAWPALAAGTYFINTSTDNANPVLTQPDGVTVIVPGLFYDPTPADVTNRDEIAVFTFDNIDIPAGVTIQGLAMMWDRHHI